MIAYIKKKNYCKVSKYYIFLKKSTAGEEIR